MKKYFETKVGAEKFAKEVGGKVVMQNVPDYMGVITVIYVEYDKYHTCNNCKYFFEDNSVGVAECESDNLSEEDYDKYCVEGCGENCPYFCALRTDKEIEAEEAYISEMMKEK